MSKIPKVIHYCWFGNKRLPKSVIKCIRSWKKYCPDYKIIEWNEKNFNINSNKYTKEAYKSKKWAFVSDYVRLFVLYRYGGIYIDTDVELFKNIDIFLKYNAFFGIESKVRISTGIIGCIPKCDIIGYFFSYYSNKSFIYNGKFDLTTNVSIITNIVKQKYNLELNNEFKVISENIAIYPQEYFCPLDIDTGKLNITKNTYAIHYYNGSWMGIKEVLELKLKSKLRNILGEKNYIKLKSLLKS